MTPTRRVTAAWKRRVSIMAYGLVTRLYGPDTQPARARRRFERLATVTRASVKAKYPNVVFPPLFLVVGGHEVLLDDALRVESRAGSAGVDVDTCVGRGMQRDFPLTLPGLEESREAWAAIVAFLDRTAPATTHRRAAPVGGTRPTDAWAG